MGSIREGTSLKFSCSIRGQGKNMKREQSATAALVAPLCPVAGSTEVVSLPNGRRVPRKCSTCEHLFESSSCSRPDPEGLAKAIDWGHCGVKGSSALGVVSLVYPEKVVVEYRIPQKCVDCPSLCHSEVLGLKCNRLKPSNATTPFSDLIELDWSEIPQETVASMRGEELEKRLRDIRAIRRPFGVRDWPSPELVRSKILDDLQ